MQIMLAHLIVDAGCHLNYTRLVLFEFNLISSEQQRFGAVDIAVGAKFLSFCVKELPSVL